MPIDLVRVGEDPVAVRINGHEFPCEEEAHEVTIPMQFLAGSRLSDIPDDIIIKPVESIEDNVIKVEHDIGLTAFRHGAATAIVEEMFRRKVWDGNVGLTPYIGALRDALAESESSEETDFDDDDDYVLLRYEVSITEDVPLLDAIALVDAEIEHIHERADQLAHKRRDGLLGVFDRGAFNSELQHVLRGKQPIALIMLDIDHFKKVNDRFGHQIGDAVLKAVAKVLSDKCDGHHRVEYRYGGEELSIIVRGRDAAIAAELAEGIRAEVESLRFENADLHVTASLGVATAGEDRDGQSLIKRADAALYRAKKQGRNRVVKDASAESTTRLENSNAFRLVRSVALVLLIVLAVGLLWMTRYALNRPSLPTPRSVPTGPSPTIISKEPPMVQSRPSTVKQNGQAVDEKTTPKYQAIALADELMNWMQEVRKGIPDFEEWQAACLREYHHRFEKRAADITARLNQCGADTTKLNNELQGLRNVRLCNITCLEGLSSELREVAHNIPDGQPECGTGKPTPGFGLKDTGTYYLSMGGGLTGYYKEDLEKAGENGGRTTVGEKQQFKLYIRNGKLCLDAKIYAGLQVPVIEVLCNRIDSSRARGWDTNYTEDAVEVVDQNQVPMFQMIFETPSKIQVNGVFPIDDNHVMIYAPSGAINVDLTKNSALQVPIKRLFKYPAWRFRGQYAD